MQKIQRAFSAGELSPSSYGRVDLTRYQLGLRTLRNFIIQHDGGAVNRPGTVFVHEMKDSAVKGRLIKFVNDADRVVIEMGQLYLRFVKNHRRIVVPVVTAWADATTYAVGDLVSEAGTNYQCIQDHFSNVAYLKPGVGMFWEQYWVVTTIQTTPAWVNATVYAVGDLVVDTGVYYYCITAHTSATLVDKPGSGSAWNTVWYALTSTIYEIPTPYSVADLPNVQYVQSGDVITLTCPGQPRYTLTKTNDVKWVLAQVVGGPSVAAPASVAAAGGAAGATMWWAVTAVLDGTFEESLVGIYTNNNKVPSEDTPTTISWNAVPRVISYNVYRSDDGQTYGLIGSVGGVQEVSVDTSWTDTGDTHTSSADNTTSDNSSAATNVSNALPAATKAADGKYKFNLRTTLTVPAAATGTFFGYAIIEASKDGGAYSACATITLDQLTGPGVSGPKSVEFTVDIPDTGYTQISWRVRPGLVTGVTTGASTASFLISSATPPDDRITWAGGLAAFVDHGRDADMAIAPPKTIIEFAIANEFPEVVGHYQQRRVYANTPTGRNKVWASKVGSPGNFAYCTPLQDDDPVVFQLDGKQANPVRHLLDLGRLVIFTSSGELVAEGNRDGVLTPAAINVRQHSYNGASRLSPLVVNNRALYVQARGSYVRSIHPDDVPGSISTNLSLLASHMFRGKTLVDWDVADYPNRIVWCVRSDGTLLGMTWIPEAEQWGWHRHDTDGTFENVCCIPALSDGNEEDIAYFIVNRTINGSTKRYIEYLPTRYYNTLNNVPFMDCSIPKMPSGTAVSGLSHLQGKTVSVTQVGNIYGSPRNAALPAYVVAAGAIDVTGQSLQGTFLGAGVNVQVGLPYTYDMEPLDIDVLDDHTTLKHAKLLVSRVALYLDNTYQLYVGNPDKPTGGNFLNGLQPLAKNLDPNDDTTTKTGVRHIIPTSGWGNGRMLIRGVDPTPVTVLTISPEFNSLTEE